MLERFLSYVGLVLGAWAAYLVWQWRNRGRYNRLARPGTVFVCQCCGKRSHDRNGEMAIDDGWDTSCRTWAQLCDDNSLIFGDNGRVAKARAA